MGFLGDFPYWALQLQYPQVSGSFSSSNHLSPVSSWFSSFCSIRHFCVGAAPSHPVLLVENQNDSGLALSTMWSTPGVWGTRFCLPWPTLNAGQPKHNHPVISSPLFSSFPRPGCILILVCYMMGRRSRSLDGLVEGLFFRDWDEEIFKLYHTLKLPVSSLGI